MLRHHPRWITSLWRYCTFQKLLLTIKILPESWLRTWGMQRASVGSNIANLSTMTIFWDAISQSLWKYQFFHLIWAINPLSMTSSSLDTQLWLIHPHLALWHQKNSVPDIPMVAARHFFKQYIHAFHMPKAFSVWKIWSKFPRFDSAIKGNFDPKNQNCQFMVKFGA